MMSGKWRTHPKVSAPSLVSQPLFLVLPCTDLAPVIDAGPTNDPSKWRFSYLRIWNDHVARSMSGKEALHKFKQMCESFCEPYRSAAEWIPEESACNIDRLKYWVPVPWNDPSRRVTLAGDAAHALLPCTLFFFSRNTLR